MVRDLLALMDALGISEFSVVGHDRGSYAAVRFGLDYPQRLSKVALLDCLPMKKPTVQRDEELRSRCSCCGHCKTAWNSYTATRW